MLAIQRIRRTHTLYQEEYYVKGIRKYWINIGVLIVLALGSLSLPVALAQKAGPVFDKCVQDNSGAPWVLLNSETGDGIFDDCKGTRFSGRGIVTRSGCTINYSLTVGTDKLNVSIDTCNQSGSATVRDSVTGAFLFTITDSKFKDNTCVCGATAATLAPNLDQ